MQKRRGLRLCSDPLARSVASPLRSTLEGIAMDDRRALRTTLAWRTSRPAVLLALTVLMQLSMACSQAATPISGAPPPAAPTATTAVASPNATPTGLGCLPSEKAELVWPKLQEIKPSQVPPGGTLRVIGSGGYVRCGERGYNESSRFFHLYLDGEPVSKINCYVNHCEGDLTVPNTTLPGEHAISVEGGSGISVVVLE